MEEGLVSVRYLRGLSIDEPFARMDNNGVRFYTADALGSTSALTDANGAVKTQYLYGPYGSTAAVGDPSENPFQYTGRENDGTGLYYYRARYYDPMLGRFISEDPIGFWGGDVNLYAYVQNDPIHLVDPSGLCIEDACIGETIVAGAALSAATAAYLASPAGKAAVGQIGELFDTMSESLLLDQDIPTTCEYKEHKKGERPSTKDKHEKGKTRKGTDKRGGEKGDSRRPYKR